MADRRADESPLAPHRSLNAPAATDESEAQSRRPLSERVSAAVAAAGSAVQSARSNGSGTAHRATGADRGPDRADRVDRSGTTTTSRAAGKASPAPRPRPRGTRRARLRLVHVDPWSVMKTAFLLSIAFGIVTVVAVAVVWSVLGAAGVWDSINQAVSDVVGGQSASTFDVQNYVGTSRVLGFTMIVAVFDVLLITAIATLGAFLYNLAAALLGGLEVTLAEDDH